MASCGDEGTAHIYWGHYLLCLKITSELHPYAWKELVAPATDDRFALRSELFTAPKTNAGVKCQCALQNLYIERHDDEMPRKAG